MNKFIFHSIGQGLFYTGSLYEGNYNFVYDCGTEKEKARLNKEIGTYVTDLSFKKNNTVPTIDFVVISHLHKDHFSGLIELIKSTRIKKLYLPYLPTKSYPIVASFFLVYAIYEEQRESSLDREYDYYMYQAMRRLYKISSNDFPNDNAYEELKEISVEFELSNNEQLYCFKDDYSKQWEFHLFGKPFPQEKYDKLNSLLDSNPPLKKRIIDIQDLTDDDLKEIRSIYEKVFGKKGLNSTSLVLLHKPVLSEFISIPYCGHCFYNFKDSCMNESTLLTGDAEFTMEMFDKLLNFNRGIQLCVLQIPHHGSKKNWNIYMKCLTANLNVISFGKNTHSLPSPLVLRDLLINRKIVKTTEKSNVEYYL